MKEERRETVSFRIQPSVEHLIKSRSRLFGMTIGEYVEYLVMKDGMNTEGNQSATVAIYNRLLSIKEEMSEIFNMIDVEMDRMVDETDSIDKDEVSRWMSYSVRKLTSPETKSRELLFKLIEEGIGAYKLTDYGVSILENAFNPKIPIRE